MKQVAIVISSVIASLVLTSCNAGKNKTNIELVTAMMDQESVKFQDWDPKTKDNFAMRVPPENTVPRGYKPYAYKGEPEEAGRNLKNPLGVDYSKETLELGKKKFDIYCALCHGPSGAGDGQIAPKMILKPPALVSDKVKNFPDGRIFHIITDGQGTMGSYLVQIQDEKARWAVVNYVRTLQKRSSAN
ncbi:MAG: cytochrome c [Bdellovibrionaceae bacterium]|nr:cytochrome c [Pseudobdellovibrionaceae bacterium]